MHNILKIDFPARPDLDSTWHKEQVEEDMRSKHCILTHDSNWIQWALVEALGDACDPKETEPLNMFAENNLVTSLTIDFVDGPCKLTKI